MRIPGRPRSSDDSDWATQATKTITNVVDGLHDAAVVPLTTIARAVVFGMLVLIVGAAAITLVAIGGLRLADIYLDNIPGFPEGVWVAYLFVGAIFVLASLFLWSKRTADKVLR